MDNEQGSPCHRFVEYEKWTNPGSDQIKILAQAQTLLQKNLNNRRDGKQMPRNEQVHHDACVEELLLIYVFFFFRALPWSSMTHRSLACLLSCLSEKSWVNSQLFRTTMFRKCLGFVWLTPVTQSFLHLHTAGCEVSPPAPSLHLWNLQIGVICSYRLVSFKCF